MLNSITYPNTGAANQTIGIFNGGGNYDPKDIKDYINGLPTGYRTQPTINEVDLKVDGTTFKNDPTSVSSWSNGDMEITQDIETAVTVAQGVTVQVYCSTSTEDGWSAFLSRVMAPQGTENTPTVLSSSWFINTRDDSDFCRARGYSTPSRACLPSLRRWVSQSASPPATRAPTPA